MEQNHAGFLKGQLLMAMPGLMDPNFIQTVTCISEHTANGAFGIVVNRVHAMLTGKDIFKELGVAFSSSSEDLPIHIGGPVHVGEIFILHGPPFRWRGCLQINATLALSNTMDVLEAIAQGKGPVSCMVALGCAGWGPGQLESEIRENAWLTGPVFDDILFEVPVPERWEAAIRKIGVNPDRLSGQAGHA